MVKAVTEAASTTDRPAAISTVWTTRPVVAPAKAASPAARDCATVFDRKRVMSGPGVSPSTIEAPTKAASTGSEGTKSASKGTGRSVGCRGDSLLGEPGEAQAFEIAAEHLRPHELKRVAELRQRRVRPHRLELAEPRARLVE